MTEKELDSMATVQIKPEYAASEVYSTTSEPPPAYKRQATSVQIAKIVAFTVILSSFIIGAFILASAYLQARASCDQMQALDSVLEKELMLETLQQVNKEIPRAEALIGKEGNNDEADLQSIDKEEPIKKEEEPKQEQEVHIPSLNENEPETDSSFSDSDEADDLQKTQMKVPLELDLSDLAAALLANNQKSRMNCVVERKHAEEIVDSPAKTMQLPFGLNLSTDPKKAKFSGERISIFCESGNEEEKKHEDAEQIPPLFFPIQRLPIPFGPQLSQVPLTHMPQRMQPQPMVHQMPPAFQPVPIRPPVPPQIMQAPRPEPQLRIQVQRIPIRELHLPFPMPNNNEEQSVPLHIQLQRARIPETEITEEDIRNIQRIAEQFIPDVSQRYSSDDSASSVESSDTSTEEDESESSQSQSNEQNIQQQHPPQPQQTLHPPMPESMMPFERVPFARNLPTPVRIPVPMTHQSPPQEPTVRIAVPITHQVPPQEPSPESAEPQRQHYIHPRSIPDTPKAEKRIKRFACDCKS